jgi:hypothetical protein
VLLPIDTEPTSAWTQGVTPPTTIRAAALARTVLVPLLKTTLRRRPPVDGRSTVTATRPVPRSGTTLTDVPFEPFTKPFREATLRATASAALADLLSSRLTAPATDAASAAACMLRRRRYQLPTSTTRPATPRREVADTATTIAAAPRLSLPSRAKAPRPHTRPLARRPL